MYKPPSLESYQMLHNVPVSVQAELDRKMMTVGELLGLRVDDVVVFPRPAGENISVYVAGTLIGWAEVSVTEGAMAVRMADLRNAPMDISRPADDAATGGN
jgi:flagellar motor switch protein FliN/FliY